MVSHGVICFVILLERVFLYFQNELLWIKLPRTSHQYQIIIKIVRTKQTQKHVSGAGYKFKPLISNPHSYLKIHLNTFQ